MRWSKKRQLRRYIKKALNQNIEDEKIIKALSGIGWDENTVKSTIKDIKDNTIDIVLKKPVTKEEEKKEEIKPVGISQKLDDISRSIDIITQKDKMNEKLKKKNFKLPMGVKGKLKKLAIQNKVQVMLLQRTRNISPVIGELRDGMLLIGENVYEGTAQYTWLWRGKYPTFIVPEWDLSPLDKERISEIKQPLGAMEIHKNTVESTRLADPQKIIIRAIEAKQNQMLNKKANVKGIIITIVLTLIVAAILFGGKIA